MSEELIEDVKKTDKPEYKFRLSENYAIDYDPRNIVLLERYEKRSGKGRNAMLSGEYGYKVEGYFTNFDQVAERLVQMEVFKETDEQIESLIEIANRIKVLKKEMKQFLNEKIEVKLA